MRRLLHIVAVLAIVVGVVSVTLAPTAASADGQGDFLPASPIMINGSFETGDYTGWTLWESPGPATYGTWGIAETGQTINRGQSTYDFYDKVMVNQNSPGLPRTYTTTDGQYLAYQLQNGPQDHRMYQDVTLSAGNLILSWDMFYRNHNNRFWDNQYLAVHIRDMNDNITETLFKTVEGSSPLVIGMTGFSYDISQHAGAMVRIDVEMRVRSFHFDAGFDNFKIEVIKADTATAVVSSQNPSIYDQPVTFTATVSADLSATGTPTGTVQFKIDGVDFGSPVPLSDGSATSEAISSLPAGDYIVTAVYSGDAYFNSSGSSPLVQTVNKADQTITFETLSDKTYGDPAFTVSATSSSGLPVTFTASGPCYISGDTVYITGVGTCTITAHQAGDDNYNAAPDVSQTFTVNITYERMAELVEQYVTNRGIARSMIAKLDNAMKAEVRGNINAKNGMIGAFINHVKAQAGKALSAEDADILIMLAMHL